MVWSLKHKHDPIGDIIKWKAHLCAGGHKSVEMVDQWSTHSPLMPWNTVHSMIHPDLTFSIQACAHFCNDPKQSYEEAVKQIC